jgi:hypothetical protein
LNDSTKKQQDDTRAQYAILVFCINQFFGQSPIACPLVVIRMRCRDVKGEFSSAHVKD